MGRHHGIRTISSACRIGPRAAKIAPSGEAIVIDLVELTFIGSVGLGTFLAARERPDSNGHQLLVLESNAIVRRGYELTGTEFLLDDEDVISVLEEDVLNSEPAEQ